MQQKFLDFSRYTSIRIGEKNLVNLIENTQDYYEFLQKFTPKILGKANNLLIAPNAKNLILLDKSFDYIKDCGDFLEVGAMTPSKKLFLYAKEHNLGGFEILSHLPGCIGGIIKMNAGLKEYEIKSVLDGILSIKDSYKLEFIASEALNLQYRKSAINTLIFAGIFKKNKGFNESLVETFKTMRKNQPKEPSFGSCFKNPQGNFAGALIEKVGLKGQRFGKNKNLCFSEIHANFLVNFGGSTFNEALDLIALAQEKVQNAFKITLEKEVQILE